MLYIFDLGNVIVDIDFQPGIGSLERFNPHPAGDAGSSISPWVRLSISMSAASSAMKTLPPPCAMK